MLSTIKHKFVALAVFSLLMAIHVAPAAEREEYAQVQAKDLVRNPQLYWARGIVFKDTLVAPPTVGARKLGDRTVVPFKTKIAGECFAEESVVEALKNAGAGAQCVFSATVFQETFWFSKSRFRIIIQEFSLSATSATDIRGSVSNLATSVGTYGLVAQRLDSILSQIQSELMAFSGESGTPMSEILNPDGPHRERTMNSVRNAIARIEEEMRAPSSVFLTDLITAILAGQHAPTAAPKPAGVEAPPAAPKAETTSVETKIEAPAAKSAAKPSDAKGETTGDGHSAPAPAKRSFWSRLFGSSDKPVATKTSDSAQTSETPKPAAGAPPAR